MKLFSLRALEQLLMRKLRLLSRPISKQRKKRAPSKRLNATPLVTQGELHDLQAIYTSLNNEYFNNTLDLRITWFGSAGRIARRHRRLGLYCFDSKLIKIHRLLDRPDFPPYFISYVVYHEMLHCVCPPVKAKRGRYSIHHRDFKKKEMEFADYAVAKRWEKENRRLFFNLPKPLSF